MVGVAYLPFGLFNGFVAAALPLLLTQRGLALDRVASITFVVLLPSFLSFLLTPLVDCGLPRRVWAWVLACVAAVCLACAVLGLDAAVASPHGRALLTAALTLGYLSVQMYGSTIGGMVPNLVDERRLAAAGMWLNIAYLGGMAGGTLIVVAVTRLPRVGAAGVGVLEMLLPPCILLLARHEVRQPRRVAEAMRTVLRDLWRVVRQPHYALGFLVFLAPAATFAATNYFGGMGADFGAPPGRTAWITGVGVAILSSVGAVLGGWLSSRYDRRWLFVGAGVLSSIATLGMVFGPRLWWIFFVGVSLYALLGGVNYVAASALAFQLIGRDNPLSATLYAMLMAACNVAIETMVLSDGHAYRVAGARGLLLAEGVVSICVGVSVLALVSFVDKRAKAC